VEIRLLGGLRVIDATGNPVEVHGAKERALLALLALRPGEAVSIDTIVESVWPNGDPESAAPSLRVRLANLRRAVGGESVIRIDAGCALQVGREDVDAARFEDLVAEGRYDDALALWHGEPLAGIAGDWVLRERRVLEELRFRALQESLSARIGAGKGAAGITELQQLVELEPLRERPRELLMRALYQAGRQVDALAVYQETRRLLDEELGLEPSPALRELERAILTHDARLAPPNPRPVAARARRMPQLGVAGVTGAIAVVAAALLLSFGPGRAHPRLQPNSIGVIDPRTGKLTAVAGVGRDPVGIAIGLGHVWVANAGDSTLTRLDPRTLDSTTIGLPSPPTAIAIGHRAAWVAVEGPDLIQVLPSGGTTDIPLPRRAGAVTSNAAGILVALSGGDFRASPIVIIDPTTHQIVTRGQLPNPAVAAAVDGDKTWIVTNDWHGAGRLLANIFAGQGSWPITAADVPSSGAFPAPICVGASQGELWIPATGAKAVWRLSAAGDVRSIALPAHATCIADTSDRIWLSSPEGVVLVLDPQTSRAHAVLRTTASLTAIAAGFDRIWVASY
jgi:DNA-binding SARP family transcriptional activator